jgi:DNA-directed RNA polymerase specialized sigma subunit
MNTNESLITDYLYLVKLTLYRSGYANANCADELMDVGRLALVKAANDFNENKEKKFKSWAISKIRWAMQDYWRSIDSMSLYSRRFLKKNGYLPMKKIKLKKSRLKPKLDINSIRKGLLYTCSNIGKL